MKTAIFSGRFDPVHLGHVLTVLKLLERFGCVVVAILDYPEREGCTAREAFVTFQTVFTKLIGPDKVALMINDIHFGKITKNEYFSVLQLVDANFDDSVYVSGNLEVIEHFKKLKIPYEFIGRSGSYSGTEERNDAPSCGTCEHANDTCCCDTSDILKKIMITSDMKFKTNFDVEKMLARYCLRYEFCKRSL